MLKLWYSPGACSLAPHILLYEIGEPFEAIETPVSSGAHLTSEFTLLNSKNRVPVLATEGHVITELPAISAAISLRAPELGLMGRSAMEKVRVLEWLNWLSGTVHGQGFGCLWRPQRFTAAESAFEGIKKQGQATIAECFQAIEQRVGDAHASGTSFTAVDAFLLVFFRWGNRIGLNMHDRYPRFTALVAALAERPSVQSALRAERVSLAG